MGSGALLAALQKERTRKERSGRQVVGRNGGSLGEVTPMDTPAAEFHSHEYITVQMQEITNELDNENYNSVAISNLLDTAIEFFLEKPGGAANVMRW